jgi:hypothetical protein
MAALPKATYGLENLLLFPIYQTRAQYEKATGKEPPPFDPTRPPKSWFDPAAAADTGTRRNIIYENVIAYDKEGKPIPGPDGKPMLESMLLSKVEAGSVNIPMKVGANEPGTEVPEVPAPLRALEPDEYLDFGWSGIVIVRNRKFDEPTPTVFNVQDREIIKAIARKLGVAI